MNVNERKLRALITGGCGFIGTNLAAALCERGYNVVLFDNLSRPRTENNLKWLKENYSIEFLKGDLRNFSEVSHALQNVNVVFHLAAQVAVTTSLKNPREDFEINILGTFNLLEAARQIPNPPAILYASTNKVYGGLESLTIAEGELAYYCPSMPRGIDEEYNLDFHSPYGCSKGAADQYVRDYSRIYGLQTVVFRQSCIYGPRQFGVEDQGWLAHFAIATLKDKSLTIYGNGKQVRDALHVNDLIELYLAAVENISSVSGQIFNVGGGANNTISIWAQFGPMLKNYFSKDVQVKYAEWRAGDQPWFVANISKAKLLLGWEPKISIEQGIRDMFNWIQVNSDLF